ncbi:hypothetical protein WS52_27160 [Burkholderia territorii]|nr:hypothetical protein WS52_27160 [Burkholderia territorii]KUZ44126.1 hypothetical protein WS53_29900 [Burkholderia territorii]
MQMANAVDTQTDTVVSVCQVVFAAQVERLKIVCLQIAAHDTERMRIDIKRRDLLSLMSQNAVMTKDDRIDRIPCPRLTQIELSQLDDVKTSCGMRGRPIRSRNAFQLAFKMTWRYTKFAALVVDACPG